MTKQKILENNKLIAEFIGSKYSHEVSAIVETRMREVDLWTPFHGIVRFDTIETGKGKILRYHKSWDWLMPIVEQCLSSPEDDSRDFDRHYDAIHDALWSINIEDTYKAVVEFIKWYNDIKR